MEKWDLYDRNGQLMGKTINRGARFRSGEHHLVTHVWVVNSAGRMLIQRRSSKRRMMPNIWAITSGSAVAGENSITAARRELAEELGISLPESAFIANLILFSVTLRLYSVWVVHKQIKEFKEETELYYNAIHTAYFCEKIARKLNMDVDLAKAGGYYHKIIPEKARKEDGSIQEICDRYQFPREVGQLLAEYTDKSIPLHKKETTVVLFADTMVSSIMYLFRKDSGMEPDYQAIAASIFKRKQESGVLRHSDISMNDLRVMEKIFAGEKLYYDFLR